MPPASTSRRIAAALLAATLLPAGVPAGAEADAPKPLALRRIMQDMGRGMEEITRAISMERWDVVARAARGIAEHGQPPLPERARILGFMGSEAGAFRGRDEEMKKASLALEKAAAAGDGRRVIGAFADLQASCLACHESFRPRFVEHFHGPER